MHCDWFHVFDFVGQLQWLGLRSCRFHVGAGAFGAWLCLWEITRVFGKNNLVPTVTGLRLPWHRRRTTRRLRADFMLVHALLSANLGRGYYSYAHFRPAPPVWTEGNRRTDHWATKTPSAVCLHFAKQNDTCHVSRPCASSAV